MEEPDFKAQITRTELLDRQLEQILTMTNDFYSTLP